MCVPKEILRLRGLKRVFVEEIQDSAKVTLDGKSYHRLGMVLRARLGEDVLVMDRKGNRAIASVEEINRGSIGLKIKEMVLLPLVPGPEVIVVQALLKNQSNDYLIQKLSELGVKAISFFEAKRGILRWSNVKAQDRLSHWDGVAIRAFLQCDRDVPIQILGPFSDAKEVAHFHKGEKGLKVVFHEKASLSLKELLRSQEREELKKAILAVGPEGGFTEEEVEWLRESEFIPTCLGPRILKAESVAMVAATIIQWHCQS